MNSRYLQYLVQAVSRLTDVAFLVAGLSALFVGVTLAGQVHATGSGLVAALGASLAFLAGAITLLFALAPDGTKLLAIETTLEVPEIIDPPSDADVANVVELIRSGLAGIMACNEQEAGLLVDALTRVSPKLFVLLTAKQLERAIQEGRTEYDLAAEIEQAATLATTLLMYADPIFMGALESCSARVHAAVQAGIPAA